MSPCIPALHCKRQGRGCPPSAQALDTALRFESASPLLPLSLPLTCPHPARPSRSVIGHAFNEYTTTPDRINQIIAAVTAAPDCSSKDFGKIMVTHKVGPGQGQAGPIQVAG